MSYAVDFIVALDKRIQAEFAQPTPNAALIAQLRNMILKEKFTSNQSQSTLMHDEEPLDNPQEATRWRNHREIAALKSSMNAVIDAYHTVATVMFYCPTLEYQIAAFASNGRVRGCIEYADEDIDAFLVYVEGIGHDIVAFLHHLNTTVESWMFTHGRRCDMGKSEFTRFTQPGFTTIVPPDFEHNSIAIKMNYQCLQDDATLADWRNRMLINGLRQWLTLDQYFSITVTLRHVPTMKRRIAAFATDARLRGRAKHISDKRIEIEAEGLGRNLVLFLLLVNSVFPIQFDVSTSGTRKQGSMYFTLFHEVGWTSFRARDSDESDEKRSGVNDPQSDSEQSV